MPVPPVPAAPVDGAAALWWAAFGVALLVYLALALAVGARLVAGHLAAERVVAARGLDEPLDPGSRAWNALMLARSLAGFASVLTLALGPLRGHALLAGALGAVGVALVGRIAESALAPRAPERILRAAAPLLRLVDALLGPATTPLARAHERQVERRRGDARREDDEEAREEQLEEYIRDAEEGGILEKEESALLREIVDAGDVTVREVMTPRVEVVAVSADATLAAAAEVFSSSRHSRLLVHDGGLDQIVGVLPVRDLLPHLAPAGGDVRARSLARPALHVPATKKVLELLRELQEERQQIAVVVDEYGGTAGIVSLEDLVEEIVGEIRDEHEPDEEPIRADGKGALLVDGLVPLEEFEERTGKELTAEGVETVGGLVFARLGRLPRLGDVVEAAPGLRLEVTRLRGRRVAQVRAVRVEENP